LHAVEYDQGVVVEVCPSHLQRDGRSPIAQPAGSMPVARGGSISSTVGASLIDFGEYETSRLPPGSLMDSMLIGASMKKGAR
jgi:hypothetical protein